MQLPNAVFCSFYNIILNLVGRGKHCSEEKRLLIKDLRQKGKTYREIKEILGCSDQMITNALNYKKRAETRGRKPKTSSLEDRLIVRYSKGDPSASSKKIKQELDLDVSTVTIRRRLLKNKLFARSPRKVPLLTKKQAAARLKFAQTHINWPKEKWRNILWTDESKIVLFGGTGSRQYVRRPPNTEYKAQYTIKTVKHGGAKIMIWGCFSYGGVGPIHPIKGIMDKRVYVNIMSEVMLPYSEWSMPIKWVFQQDNDPKHTSKLAKEWFRDNRVEVMPWPAQSPDLNPIEHLWGDVKKYVAEKMPSNVDNLWTTIQDGWQKIPLKRCQDLIDSMPRRCAAVIKNRGYSTKY